LPWKKVLHFQSVSLALVIQQGMLMRRILLLPLACLAVPYFPRYLITGTIFGKKVIQHKMRV
jgi:hypothetical protein